MTEPTEADLRAELKQIHSELSDLADRQRSLIQRRDTLLRLFPHPPFIPARAVNKSFAIG